MEANILVLCDPEKDYAQQLAAFLAADRDFPWKIVTCSCLEEADRLRKEGAADLLVLAESLLENGLPEGDASELLVLNESGRVRFTHVRNVNKYQAAENVLRELLKLYIEREAWIGPALHTGSSARKIGLYSPVRRCLQTGFGITLGQQLAEKGRVLYLNFGYYPGHAELEAASDQGDMTALLYYADSSGEKFGIKLKTLVRSVGNWDYVPGIRNGEDLLTMTGAQWLELVEKCAGVGEYDYVVLDLSESMQGLTDMLECCDLVLTLLKEDEISLRKVDNYENGLKKRGCSKVLSKSRKLILPEYYKLPQTLEEYTKGKLAEYVDKCLAEGLLE